jgi:hypothetical protein
MLKLASPRQSFSLWESQGQPPRTHPHWPGGLFVTKFLPVYQMSCSPPTSGRNVAARKLAVTTITQGRLLKLIRLLLNYGSLPKGKSDDYQYSHWGTGVWSWTSRCEGDRSISSSDWGSKAVWLNGCPFFSFPFFFFFCSPGAWTQGLHHESLHQPFLCDELFADRVL